MYNIIEHEPLVAHNPLIRVRLVIYRLNCANVVFLCVRGRSVNGRKFRTENLTNNRFSFKPKAFAPVVVLTSDSEDEVLKQIIRIKAFQSR